jgi:FtsP/CotA-like multicopper oxidase with cupredoxin domain
MTALLLRALRRRPVGVLARPSSVMALTLALGYASGLWTVFLHAAEGGHERNEPPFLIHWLRDSTLALPIIFMTVWLAVVLARRVIDRERDRISARMATTVLACFVAIGASLATAAGNPAHSALFGAHHGGPELPLALHILRDGLAVLAVNLPIALAVCALLRRARPWSAPRVSSWSLPTSLKGRLALRASVLVVIVAPAALFAQNGAELAAAGAGPGAPCPTGAPVKTFAVTAIKVKIPLNRFGDNDPEGLMYVGAADADGLARQVAAVRRQEQTQHVSTGLRDDPIQPLVIRANEGDCVNIAFTNDAGDEYGMHIDGLSYDVASSGDAVGNNTASSAAGGETVHYRYYVPEDDNLEGSHYIRPGAGNRYAVQHGLFGSLSVEPQGSTYLDMDTGEPIETGWEAIVKPGAGKSFREYVNIYHEVGDEGFDIRTADGGKLPRVDPHTSSYRPGSRAMNYRSEPFFNRLERKPGLEGYSYNSYTFGDPSTPMPRGYLGDPTKIRIQHAGAEMFHVFHLHGGGIRWRQNPHADKTFDYADTGLDKTPKAAASPSSRLDSQSFGPGESYDLQIEGGAGGVQQSAGDFLFHCHIAEHYVSGMWSFWRTYDTRQPDLFTLPDRAAKPSAVDSAHLIGRTMPDGTTITKDNLDAWIRPQLPTAGVPNDGLDGSVWDWTVDRSAASAPLYLGEPEERAAWPNLRDTDPAFRGAVPGHPGGLPVDRSGQGGYVGARPKILFDPVNGRPAYPLLRPHIGQRAPFSPDGHSGAPWLGATAGRKPVPGGGPQPFAGRPDGLCPTGARPRTYNVVSIQLPIKITPAGATDPEGKIFVLAKDVPDILAGRKAPEPLAIRANIGDCVAVTLTTQLAPTAEQPLPMSNIHIHHVQFDVQASDGVGTGMQFGQVVQPYRTNDPSLAEASDENAGALHLSSVDEFRAQEWIAVGEGTDDIEVRQIESIDPETSTVTLTEPLDKAHAVGDFAGDEFVQYRWYPDVALDNVFFHDHVDGIHNWGHGLVGQLIVEPPGSTYHDPKTGAEIDSGALADIHTSNPLAPGVPGSFRELALWTIDDNPVTDSVVNLRATPFSERAGDPSLVFSSYKWGDPNTPLPRAYAGDPLVVRTINVSAQVDSLRLDNNRFSLEPRLLDGKGRADTTLTDSHHYGISERFTDVLDGGGGGPLRAPGDYLYLNGVNRRVRQGAWGLIRVLPKAQLGGADGLRPLPGYPVAAGAQPQPAVTGDRPPAADGPGSPCPVGAPRHAFAISAVDVPGGPEGATSAFVPTDQAAAVAAGTLAPEPLVIHVSAGECVTVDFTNARTTLGARDSFDVGELLRTPASSGVNAGFNPEQTVARGEHRTYRYLADTERIGSASISDMGDLRNGTEGLYGMVVVAPAGATFSDPVGGRPTSVGTAVDVHVPGGQDYRDFSVIMSDSDPIIGGNFMPYPPNVSGAALLNYSSAQGPGDKPRADDPSMLSSIAHGDPKTAILRAYPGDPVQVHDMVAPGSEQTHTFSLGGQSFLQDPRVPASQQMQVQGIAPWETHDHAIVGGAGGVARTNGDFFYGDLRRPFTDAGLWGLMRVAADPSCPIRPLTGLGCGGQASLVDGARPVAPITPVAPKPTPKPPAGGAAPAPAAPKAAAPAGGQTQRLSGLRVAHRVSLRSLRRSGLRLRLLAPGDTRALRLQLFRRGGSGSRAPVRLVATARLQVRHGGPIAVVWRPTRRVAGRLRPGPHVLAVTAGPSAGRMGRTSARASLTLR